MKESGKRKLYLGFLLVAVFVVYTYLVQTVDVKPLGVNGTDIGFSTLNCLFHKACGVHMALYAATDWAGLVPLLTAGAFGVLGLIQLVKRRSLLKVDADILILGVYYAAVIALYLAFERIPINYRPILIGGFMEVSYPSSTTLLTLGVMPTLPEQVRRRCKSRAVIRSVCVLSAAFSAFMVIGRTVCGVHWLTDIVGSVIISAGLFCLYQGAVYTVDKNT